MNHNDAHTEAIAALLAGGLDPAEAAALEAQLRDAGDATAVYRALRDLAARLEALGDTVRLETPAVDLVAEVLFEAELVALGEVERHRAGTVDLVDDVVLGARLLDLGDSVRKQTPEADLVDDVLMAAQLGEAGDAWREAVPEVDLVDDVLMARALQATGDTLRKHTPEVELVDDVMRKVRRSKAPARVRLTSSTDEFSVRRARSQGKAVLWLGVAAAACLLVGGGLILFGLLTQSAGPNAPLVAANEPGDTGTPVTATNPVETVGVEEGMAPVRVTPITVGASLDEEAQETSQEDSPAPDAKNEPAFTISDILLARANALGGTQGDRELLARWASLTAAQARALLESGALTREEALGLSLFLPGDEAIDVLLAQLGQNPDDPYLRMALAKNLEANGQNSEAMTQLAALQRADAYNGLASYMEAELHLQSGNLSAAMAALERAGAHDLSYAYAGTTARARAAALEASGMGANEAQLLSAITAGSVEYEQVTALADQMLQYGLYYEGLGDYETANALYQSVESLGVQVTDGAGYINERIAGLQVQGDALQSQQNLAEVLGSAETAQAITDSLRLLSLAWGEMEGYLADFNQFFAGAGIDIMNSFAETILSNGDFGPATQNLLNSTLGN